jgi:predicted AlkP superfamily phosphohydrolase/phosphomutase
MSRCGQLHTGQRTVQSAALCVLLALAAFGCAKKESPSAQTTVVALDGTDWRNVLPLIRQGKMPVMEALWKAGASGTMRTNPDFRWSPVLWTSIATGKLPEKHGVTSFMAEVPGVARLVPTPSTNRKCRAIWNIFSQHDHSVGFVGWWVTWPAEPVKGFMVSDHFSVSKFDLGMNYNAEISDPVLSEKQTYPEELLKEIDGLKVARQSISANDLSHFANLPRDFVFPASLQRFDRASEFAIAYSVDRTHFGAGRKLLAEKKPELFGVFFQGVDVLQHFLWEMMDPEGSGTNPAESDRKMWGTTVERYYNFADGLIGQLVEAGGPDRAVLIVSDHGFRPGTERYAAKHISGEHRREAFFLFAGPGIRRGQPADEVDAVDITPTLLAYHGLPAAKDMDGEPIVSLFTTEWLAAHPVKFVDTYEKGEWVRPEIPDASMSEGLEERIRSIGYIQ